jgi:glycosyltransferase involved in cell wall biosynthesis
MMKMEREASSREADKTLCLCQIADAVDLDRQSPGQPNVLMSHPTNISSPLSFSGEAESGDRYPGKSRLRIAIFDYKITRNNPIGSCHLAMLRALAAEHDFTVFAVKFDNPCPDRIRFIRVPSPARPLALLFVAYHLLAPLCYLMYRLRGGARFDLVQALESNLAFGDLLYSHFCHRMYLRHHWSKSGAKGLRGWFRWLDHQLHAWVEGFTYPRAKQVVVPSQGLARELQAEFPYIEKHLTVLPNPVSLDRLQSSVDFDRRAFRQGLGFDDDDVVGLFVALGQFERKGLPLLLQALQTAGMERVKLVVVGGEADLIARYGQMYQLGNRVKYVGMQSDVRPYLWSADVFVFPSLYETFSLVTYEAAASGLPIVVSQLYGVEDLLVDGVNGFLIDTSVAGVREGLMRLLQLTPGERRVMGQRARLAASACSEERFIDAWRAFYLRLTPQGN